MKISELGGENALIELLGRQYGSREDENLALGIGDDAALIRSGERFLIVTTDLLIENTHFRVDLIEPYLLGWKSVAVNISDIAAMGGTPTHTFISIGLPDIEVAMVEGIYGGIRDICSIFASRISGGDTVGSGGGIVINITQLGTVEPSLATKRSGARPGDVVITTGTLGDSRTGLDLLLEHGLDGARSINNSMVDRHLKPYPRVEQARAAVATGKVSAMMDISDGLATDLPRLCKASGTGAIIYADRLPISEDLAGYAAESGSDAHRLAASGGEDYELLITCANTDFEEVSAAIRNTGVSACIIGEITSRTEIGYVNPGGKVESLPAAWQHF